MRILVTGGTGFVGTRVAHALRAREHDVRALVRQPKRGKTLEAWGCELAIGDVTDPASVKAAVEGCDAVVHLVAIRQGKPEQFQRVMVDGTRNLLTAAEEAGAQRFVHMSALGTSEETKDVVPYFGAKWQMEQDVRASALTHVIFRPSFVFAKGGGILPTFVRLAKLAPVTPIIGSGAQRIQPIWIEDVAAYFAAAVELEAAANRTFELGGPDAVSWNEFWARLKKTLGQRRRPSMHVPMGLMRVNAMITERLPGNIPLTRDLLKMLESGDNVVTNDDARTTFEVVPIALDEQLRRAA